MIRDIQAERAAFRKRKHLLTTDRREIAFLAEKVRELSFTTFAEVAIWLAQRYNQNNARMIACVTHWANNGRPLSHED